VPLNAAPWSGERCNVLGNATAAALKPPPPPPATRTQLTTGET
jgi:hypothetical protein